MSHHTARRTVIGLLLFKAAIPFGIVLFLLYLVRMQSVVRIWAAVAGCTVWFVWALVRVISSVRLNLTLNEDGFVFNGREVAWDQVKSVEINDFAMLDRVFIRLWDRDGVHYTIPGSIGQAPEVHEAIKDRAVEGGSRDHDRAILGSASCRSDSLGCFLQHTTL